MKKLLVVAAVLAIVLAPALVWAEQGDPDLPAVGQARLFEDTSEPEGFFDENDELIHESPIEGGGIWRWLNPYEGFDPNDPPDLTKLGVGVLSVTWQDETMNYIWGDVDVRVFDRNEPPPYFERLVRYVKGVDVKLYWDQNENGKFDGGDVYLAEFRTLEKGQFEFPQCRPDNGQECSYTLEDGKKYGVQIHVGQGTLLVQDEFYRGQLGMNKDSRLEGGSAP